jgi:hypothetical protein
MIYSAPEFTTHTMRTYLDVTFSSEGAKPSEIINRLRSLGFKPVIGEHDMVYEWGNNASAEDSIWFADKIQATLEGFNILFHIETVDE